MSVTSKAIPVRSRGVGFLPVWAGVSLFFLFQYGVSLLRLAGTSSGMENKFSALARDKYLGFLIWQNVQVLMAYVMLSLAFAICLRPFLSWILRSLAKPGKWRVMILAMAGAFLIHGFFVLRLVETRPYFLDDAKFGYWYYELLNVVPDPAQPLVFYVLFNILPIVFVLLAAFWYWKGLTGRGRMVAVTLCLSLFFGVGWMSGWLETKTVKRDDFSAGKAPNVIVIGSDSLRGDRLGYAGYTPRRRDGLAAGGVSPRIDQLAARSVNFRNCYTPIASTLESGTSLMTSLYPHSHGFRHMYPDADTVRRTKERVTPLASVLADHGYETAVFGDWCAGYFELMPLGFERISVSSFDNFKIYMSQAVVMAHFVIPLYFDHPLGYAVFPQLGSFAQFVTPEVVTGRVKQRLAEGAGRDKPFFWHVFYSCNHLPFRSPEPYSGMFSDPSYSGPNRSGVDFDIDAFIGGTDLENKWRALPEKEIQQIRDLYDGCARQFDDNVGSILDALKAAGLEDNTIVIITADHGDNLYEEGVTLGHGLTFNGGAKGNHIPLLVHVPGLAAKVFDEQVRSIDLAPTLADFLGVPQPESWEGKSFAGWLDGKERPSPRAFYGETGFPFVQFRVPGVRRPSLPPMDRMTFIDDSFNYQFVLKPEFAQPLVDAKQRCLMTMKWKLICTPTAEGGRHFSLYRISPDPFSEKDVASEHPEVVAVMRDALETWMDERVETPLESIFPSGE